MVRIRNIEIKHKPGEPMFDRIMKDFMTKGVYNYKAIYDKTKCSRACYITVLSYHLKNMEYRAKKFESEAAGIRPQSFKDLINY